MKRLLILLLCIITLALAKPGRKKSTSPLEKKLKNKKEEFKKTKCNHLGEDL
jgi:hypothetical protein